MEGKIKLLLLLCLGAISSCGGSGSKGEEAAPSSLLRITGSLVDWPSTASLFSGYHFSLMDADSSQSFSATLGDLPSFVVEKVPSDRKYYGLLFDPEYRFGWVLQLSGGEKSTKIFQVFQFGASPTLGSLSIEGRMLRTSEQNSLVPVSALTVRDNFGGAPDGIPDGLEGSTDFPYASVTNTKSDLDGDKIPDIQDPDIDNDGIPNFLDDDMDDDGIPDLFDTDLTQDGVPDFLQSWNTNPKVFSPRLGFRHVFHEIKKNEDLSQSTTLWFVVGAKYLTANGVKVVSGSYLNGATYSDGSPFTGDLFDDGTRGDGVAGDGVWSAAVNLAAKQQPSGVQAVAFQVTQPDGSVAEFLGGVGQLLSGDLTVTATVASGTGDVTVKWNPKGNIADAATLNYQVLAQDAAGHRLYTSEKLAHEVAQLVVPGSYFPAGATYSIEVRALAPSPLNGFPGSSFRSFPVSFSR